jgi:hypothetical protein
MLFQKAIIEDGKVKITESKEVNQKSLTSDCWLIQLEGPSACENCEARNTEECGGGESLRKLQKRK